MIEHYTEGGRRVYTVAEAAELTGRKPEAIRQQLHRSGAQAAGFINDRLPVYHSQDLGLEGSLLKTWTLSTNVSRDSLTTVLADLGLGDLAQHVSGANSVTLSLMSRGDGPPGELEQVRKALLERGDKAAY